MADTALRLATYEDLCAVPETMVGEIIHGVLSPSTMSHDRVTKAEIYRESGIAHLWLLDPDGRTLEAFSLRDGLWARIAAIAGDSEVRIPPFDAIGFPLSRLWAD